MTEQNHLSHKPRIEFIDLAKGICILLVVQFHVAGIYHGDGWFFLLARNLRMPLYFFLSGMFFKDYGGFFLTALKKFNKLMVPFIFFILLAYFTFYLPCLLHKGLSILPPSLSSAGIWFLNLNLPVWFLFSLFLMNLMFFPILTLVRKEWLRAAIVIMIAAAAVPVSELDMFVINATLVCAPFFYLGWLCARRTDLLHRNIDRKHLVVFSAACIILAMLLIILSGKLEFDAMMPAATLNRALLYPSAALLVAALLALCKLIVRLPLVSWLGRYSIILLGTHMISHEVSKFFLRHISETLLALWVLKFAIVLALCCVAIPIMRKYFPKFCAQQDLFPLPAPTAALQGNS